MGPYGPNREAGDMAVVAPELSAPRPSDTAVAAAVEMLAIPNALAKTAEMMNQVTKQMNTLCDQMLHVAHLITESRRVSDPPARNYFLNEAHTTHVSKSQLRRERAAFKKAKAEGKAPRRPRVARKSRASGSRRR